VTPWIRGYDRAGHGLAVERVDGILRALFFEPKWRNWQTRTFEGRVEQSVGVRVPPSAPTFAMTATGACVQPQRPGTEGAGAPGSPVMR
jgi:hypothetical protein